MYLNRCLAVVCVVAPTSSSFLYQHAAPLSCSRLFSNRRERWALCTLLGFPYLHTSIKHVRCAVLLLLCQDFTRRRQNKTLTKHTAAAQQHTHFCVDGLAAIAQPRKRESKEILRVGVGLASSFRLISHLIISP